MQFLEQINHGVLDRIENTRHGPTAFRLARGLFFGVVIFVGARFAASQFLAFDFRDVLFISITAVSCLVIYWRREIGIAMIVATTAFIVHYSAIPTLSLYHFVPELEWLEPWRLLLGQGILLFLFVVYFSSREIATLRERVATPLTNAMLLFLLVIAAAATAGVVFQDVYFDQMVAFARHYSFYLTYFAVLLCLNSRKSLRYLYIILVVMAVVVGLLMVVQFAMGSRVRVFIGESIRIESLGRFAGRVLPPGIYLVWFAVPLLVAAIPAYRGHIRAGLMLALAVVSTGLLLTFTRAMWLGTLGGVVLMLIISHGRERERILRMFAVFAASIGFLLLILGTLSTDSEDYLASYVERFTSTFEVESYTAESTVGARLEEIREAWPRIIENPWLGIGIGGNYSFEPDWDDSQQAHVWVPRTYIHNVYILLLCKAGALGLAALLVMVGLFFWRAGKILRLLRADEDRAIVVGAIGATAACVIASMLQPSFARTGPASLLGVLWGSVELLRWLAARRQDAVAHDREYTAR